MFKFMLLFAALVAFTTAKPNPKPVVVEYPEIEYAAYTAPVTYYSTHYDHFDHAPHAAYTYEYAPFAHYEYLRR